MARRNGWSLVEALAAAMLLSFVLAAVATLYLTGQRQHRVARAYSGLLTDMGIASQRAVRTIRHGYRVVGNSSKPAFPVSTSGSTQAIVEVPEPGGATRTEIRFHVTSGVFYAQRADEAAPGKVLLDGVSSVTFNYFRTEGTVRVPVDGAPATATEIRISMTASRGGMGGATTSFSATATMRNAISGF